MSSDQIQEENKEFQQSFINKALSLVEIEILIILTLILKPQNSK